MRSSHATVLTLLAFVVAGCGSKTALWLGDPPDAVDMYPPVPAPPWPPEPGDGGVDGAVVTPPDGAVLTRCEPSDVVVRYVDGSTSDGPQALRTTLRVPMVDVYFLIDTTGSMSGEIEALRDAFVAVIDDAHCPSDGALCSSDVDCPGEACAANARCAPVATARRCLADPQVGLGRYAGEPGSFFHLLDISPTSETTAAAFPVAADGWGNNETMFQAMECSLSEPGECPNDCAMDGLRCAGFRPGALPYFVTISDEGDQCPYCGPDEVSVGALARELSARMIGIDTASSSLDANRQFVRLAQESGSFDEDGNPLVFAARDGRVVEAVREGLSAAARSPLPVRVELRSPTVDPAAVIDTVRLDRTSEGCFPYADGVDSDGDGFPDRVDAAGRGTTACFSVRPRARTALPAPSRHRLSAVLLHGELEAERVDLCVVVD